WEKKGLFDPSMIPLATSLTNERLFRYCSAASKKALVWNISQWLPAKKVFVGSPYRFVALVA
ncbi:MAG: hypothetical protein ACOYOD_08730, partial [Saprospiraceae bacterium]